MRQQCADSLIVANARLVTPDAVVDGWAAIRDGRMADLGPGDPAAGLRGAAMEDFQGDYCLPGLVELHTDNLEKLLMPRPGVKWPSPLAGVVAHDRQLVAAGITTVLDSICVGQFDEKSRRRELFGESIAALDQARRAEVLLADHYLHLRCELADPAVLEMFEPMARHERLRLVSFMDHTPGQRQWRDLARHREFLSAKRGLNPAEYEAVLDSARQRSAHAGPNRARLLALCRDRNLALASHDDTTAQHVRETAGLGMGVSEFPTTMEAAREARACGLAVVMGAPNVVRGQSHSGNVAAGELARHGLLDALSSDYYPPSLVEAAFVLADSGVPLPGAVAAVSRVPADVAGFPDRGRLEPGARADLLRVRRLAGGQVVVVSVWIQGRRIL